MVPRLLLLLILLPATQAVAQSPFDFFDGDRLQEIRIDIHPSDWQQLRKNFLDNTYYAADMRWLYNGKFIEVEQTAIRSRGTGSRSAVKPGILVDFNRYNANQRFLGLRSVVLRNNAQDASMLRERVAFAFMQRIGIPVPRTAHTRLYVNDEYMGVYTLVESIDETFLKDHFNDENAFLYEYDYGREDLPYFLTYRGADPGLYSPKPFQPETHESDPQAERIVAMIRTINEASDSQFETAVAEYLDLRLFAAGLAAEAYLAEQDGIIGDYGLNNIYLYRRQSSNRFQFLPWDKSQSFITVTRSPWQNIEHYVLARRTLAIPELKDVFVSTLINGALQAGGPGGWLEQEILGEYNQIRDAVIEDPVKQCDPLQSGIVRPCTNEEFEKSVADMIRFVRERNVIIAQHLRETLQALPTFGYQSFNVPESGGASILSSGSGGSVLSGHVRVAADFPAPLVGMNLIGVRNNNALVSESSVPAVVPFRAGRIYAETDGPVKTGIALANPNTRPVTVSYYLTDLSGHDFGHGNVTIAAESQMMGFLDEAPFNAPAPFRGALTFTSSLPVGVVALRSLTNERLDSLLTTLPVADLFSGNEAAPIIPHFAEGGGWSTRILLVNPGDQVLTGSLQFWSGDPSEEARVIGTSSYVIAPRSSAFVLPPESPDETRTGSVRVLATNKAPLAMSLFSYQANGVTVTEAGASATAESPAFRMFVEGGSEASIQSGVAVVNPSDSPAAVNFELLALSGQSTGIRSTALIPANAQISLFVNQLPGFNAANFQGILRFSASTAISAFGIRSRLNERGDFLIASTPPAPENASAVAELSIPLILDSGGYESQIILYSAFPGQSAAGSLLYRDRNGRLLDLRLK
jgi:spore coat protein CotH